jgi:hypothetical protein
MPIPTPSTTTVDDDGNIVEAFDSRQFRDNPLDPVVQDNIDIDINIGGRPYFATDIEVVLTDGPESNYAIGSVVPDGHSKRPDEGDPLSGNSDPDVIKIDVDNTLTEERQDTDGEITRIFTGVISNASRVERGRFEFMAFWPGFNKIQNSTAFFSLPPAEKVRTDYNGRQYAGPSFEERSQYAKTLAEEVAKTIVSDTGFPHRIFLREGGWDINGTIYGDNQKITMGDNNVPITATSPDEGALERIVNATNSVWEVDRYGRFLIGPPIPNNEKYGAFNVPTQVNSHKLRYITDTSAGKQSPAWRSILVIGDGVVSQDGWSKNALQNAKTAKFSKPVTNENADPADIEDELAEPVFRYTNLEINTASEAEHVLEKLRDDLRKQAGGGTVTVVGHPEVWPGDAIEMPDTPKQPFGLERYAVSKVTHRINNQDGYLTKIEVMGQTNATDSVWSTEVPTAEEGDGLYDFDRGPGFGR